MLGITSNQNHNKKFNVSFGTNLILGQGVNEHINQSPDDLQKIQGFKDYLAKDGKNWNATLSFDTFAHKQNSTEDLKTLMKKSVNSDDYKTLHKISNSISKMEPQKAFELINEIVSESDEQTQIEAVESAGKIKDPQIAASLIEELANNVNPKIQETAVASIQNIKDPSIRKPLVEKFAADETPKIRSIAIRSANIDDIKDSIGNYYNDSSVLVRESIIRKINWLDDDEYNKNATSLEPIIEKALNDENKQIAEEAIETAARLSDSKKAANLINNFIENSDSGYLKFCAIGSLSKLKDKEIAKESIEKFLNSTNYEFQESATCAAMELKDTKTQNYFVNKLFKNDNERIRSIVARGYFQLEDTNNLKLVANSLLNDSSPNVRRTTASSLGCIKDAKTRDALIEKYIHSPNYEIKNSMTDAIAEVNGVDHEKAIEYAQILAKDEDKQIQKSAEKLLNNLKEQSVEDHYSLNIMDGDKVIGKKQVMDLYDKDKQNMFKPFVNAYKAILGNYS